MISVIKSSSVLQGRNWSFVDIGKEIFHPYTGLLGGWGAPWKVLVCFSFNLFHRPLSGDYQVLDSSVQVSHAKQQSGDLTNEKLVKEGEKISPVLVFQKLTQGNAVGQILSLVQGTGMNQNPSYTSAWSRDTPTYGNGMGCSDTPWRTRGDLGWNFFPAEALGQQSGA